MDRLYFENGDRTYYIEVTRSEGDDPWTVLARYDKEHGTDFWARLDTYSIIPGYIHLRCATRVESWEEVA